MRRPDNEVPVSVPVCGVLNRSPDLVIAMTSTLVFSDCVEFTVEAYRRSVHGVPMSGYGFGRPETSGFSSPPLLFGIEFSDGTFASNMPGGRRMHGGLSNGRTGHGAPRHFEVTLRLDHLPPAGPFTVVTAWPFYEVPEARVVFDAAVILAAADDAERLWESATADVDWERPRLTADEQLLVMPLTGWFAERFDPTPPPPKFDEHGNEIRYVPVIVDEQGNCTEVTPVRGWRMARDDE